MLILTTVVSLHFTFQFIDQIYVQTSTVYIFMVLDMLRLNCQRKTARNNL